MGSAPLTGHLDFLMSALARTVRVECNLASGSAMLATFVKSSSLITSLHVGGEATLATHVFINRTLPWGSDKVIS